MHNKIAEKNVPARLWDFGLKQAAKIMQFIPQRLSSRSGYKKVIDNTPDISDYVEFDFYYLVWYYVKKHPGLTENMKELTCWIGVAHRIGSDMNYKVLPN